MTTFRHLVSSTSYFGSRYVLLQSGKSAPTLRSGMQRGFSLMNCFVALVSWAISGSAMTQATVAAGWTTGMSASSLKSS